MEEMWGHRKHRGESVGSPVLTLDSLWEVSIHEALQGRHISWISPMCVCWAKFIRAIEAARDHPRLQGFTAEAGKLGCLEHNQKQHPTEYLAIISCSGGALPQALCSQLPMIWPPAGDSPKGQVSLQWWEEDQQSIKSTVEGALSHNYTSFILL